MSTAPRPAAGPQYGWALLMDAVQSGHSSLSLMQHLFFDLDRVPYRAAQVAGALEVLLVVYDGVRAAGLTLPSFPKEQEPLLKGPISLLKDAITIHINTGRTAPALALVKSLCAVMDAYRAVIKWHVHAAPKAEFAEAVPGAKREPLEVRIVDTVQRSHQTVQRDGNDELQGTETVTTFSRA